MTRPVTVRSALFLLELYEGAAWVAPIAMPERSLKISGKTTERDLPSAVETDVVWTDRDVSSLSASIDGSGRMTEENAALWRARMLAGESFQARLVIAKASADGGGTFTGNFVLTAFELGASFGQRVAVKVTAASDGEIVWAAGDHD